MSLPSNPSKSFIARNPHLYGGAERHNNLPAVKPQVRENGAATKRIRQDTKPLLNKLETQWLEEMKHRWPEAKIYPQSVRFKLANGVWYKPDFFMFGFGRWPCAFECKGPKKVKGVSKGLLALKCAASLYPEINFSLVWKEGGLWKQQAVLP
jgi:hypothetical protein